MNIKTTAVLFVLVVMVGVSIAILQQQSPPRPPTVADTPVPPTQAVQQSLLVDDLTEVTGITVRQGDNPEWQFVRDTQDDRPGEWVLTAPITSPVLKWRVDQIVSRLTGLKYSVKYAPDDLSAADAGLDPPRVVITLATADDRQVTVQVGRHNGDSETFVRLGDDDAIYACAPTLKNVLQGRAIDYCNTQLFNVSADQIVRIEITDPANASGEPRVELVKTGAAWQFVKPSPAKAVYNQVERLCSTFSSLRATEWTTDSADDLARYDLDDDAALAVTVTVEIPPDPVDATSDGAAAPAEPRIETYTASFSGAGPITDDTKVYVRRGSDAFVGTVMKTTATTFRPNLKEWRDSTLFDGDPTLARQIIVRRDDDETVFERSGTTWTLTATGEPADEDAIRDLIGSLKAARALNFATGAASRPAEFGLDEPRGVIEIKFDDDRVVVLRVGGYTDPQTQRLVYVQSGDGDTVAKVRAGEVTTWLQPDSAYRDRTLATVRSADLRVLTVDRPAGDERVSITLEKSDDWQMTAPVAAAVNDNQVDQWVKLLGNWRAVRMITDVNADGLADYGLGDAAIRVGYSYQPATVTTVKLDEDGAEPETTSSVPPIETMNLRIGRHAGKAFACRDPFNDIVYEVNADVLALVNGEFRSTKLFDIEVSQVSGVRFTEKGVTLGFDQSDQGWQFYPEPDIPIDGKEVTNYLVRINDLEIARVIRYEASDWAAYGLDEPGSSLRVQVEGHDLPALLVSTATTESGEYYARIGEGTELLALPAESPDRMRIELGEFESVK